MSEGSMLDNDIDREKLFRPGTIVINDSNHQDIIEDLGKADHPRIRFENGGSGGSSDE